MRKKRRLPPRVKTGKNKGQFRKRKGAKRKKRGSRKKFIRVSVINGRLKRRKRKRRVGRPRKR